MMTIKEVSQKYDIPADTLRYYERVGAIPHIQRTSGGKRDFSETDEKWVALAKCMRLAGVPIEILIKYVQLCMQGESTFPARLQLLIDQRNSLVEQKKAIDEMINRLDDKIAHYETAVRTEILSESHNRKPEGE